MPDIRPKIEPGWGNALAAEFSKPYFAQIKEQLLAEKAAGTTIYPPGSLIFNAFNTTPFDEVKVVILGQDPYHGPRQAHGLSFSVPDGVAKPPSLINIFKELETDLGIDPPNHGNLTSWAKQGVLLLNSFLTVQARNAASHRKIGWDHFTDAAIQAVSRERYGVVFMLWGGFAKKKAPLIDSDRHLVLTAAHPSPLSAHNGFFGCKHFSRANEYLKHQGYNPISWEIGNIKDHIS